MGTMQVYATYSCFSLGSHVLGRLGSGRLAPRACECVVPPQEAPIHDRGEGKAMKSQKDTLSMRVRFLAFVCRNNGDSRVRQKAYSLHICICVP